MVLGIQIAGVLFGLLIMYYTFLKYKKRELNNREYLFWTFLWVVFICISLFPEWLDPIVKTLNVSRTFDLLVISGFLFIIGLSFITYTTVIENKKKIEEIVRKTALKKK